MNSSVYLLSSQGSEMDSKRKLKLWQDYSLRFPIAKSLSQALMGHLMSFLKTTRSMTAGFQPISAYFLLKKNEIRRGRLILTAKSIF